MHRTEIYERWAPAAGVWSLWARPVLFAQMGEPDFVERTSTEQAIAAARMPALESYLNSAEGKHTVLVVDLPGADSVWRGLALARLGYRPVPLFNACTGPHEVINQQWIIAALQAGAEHLPATLATDVPPVFLLDSLRMGTGQRVRPGDFDNRWKVFPQDFPSAKLLVERGFTRALLLQRGQRAPQEDLAHVLRLWQDAGLGLAVVDPSTTDVPTPFQLRQPPWYQAAWLRVLEFLGLRRGPRKGFGTVVPQPSHG